MAIATNIDKVIFLTMATYVNIGRLSFFCLNLLQMEVYTYFDTKLKQ